MQDFIKELKQNRNILPKNTIKTLKGQALTGNLLCAKRGLDRLKTRIHGGDFSYANCSRKLEKR